MRARRRLHATSMAFVIALMTAPMCGCQLLALPFQLIGGLVGLAVKLLPLAPLLLYEPVSPGGPSGDPAPTPADLGSPVPTDYLAGLDTLNDTLEKARTATDGTLPALDAAMIRRAATRDGQRLAAVILVPADSIDNPARLAPMIERLAADGYSVRVGLPTDGSALAGDDLLVQARFLHETQRMGVAVVAADPLDHLNSMADASPLLASLPADLNRALE